jgi:hypothetical protein
MPTGPSNDSASPPPEPDAPAGGSRRRSWLARGGGRGRGWGHLMTLAAACLVLLGGSAVAVLLHGPGGRAQAQATYCGLVTCAVLRSTAATSRVPAGAAHPASPTPVPSSRLASPRAPAPAATTIHTPAARAAAVATPKPAQPPRPAPKRSPTSGPGPSRWPWPVWWRPSGWWGHGHGYPASRSGGSGGWPGGGR